jgi:hypothetical protein
MRKTAFLILALCTASVGAEAHLHRHQPRQSHVAATALTPPPSARIFGYDTSARQPEKAVQPHQVAPRPYAHFRRFRPVYAAPYHARIHYAFHRPRVDEDEAPAPRSFRYTRHDEPTAKPALYVLTKVTAHALGVTDNSLLFSPTAVANMPQDHFSKAAPWAGSLRY